MEMTSYPSNIAEYDGQLLIVDDTTMFIFDKRRNKWIRFPDKS